MSVEVKSPMTPQSYVKAIYVLSDKNPRPLNGKFILTPGSGQAYVATSLRLADTGDVRAVAEMVEAAHKEQASMIARARQLDRRRQRLPPCDRVDDRSPGHCPRRPRDVPRGR